MWGNSLKTTLWPLRNFETWLTWRYHRERLRRLRWMKPPIAENICCQNRRGDPAGVRWPGAVKEAWQGRTLHWSGIVCEGHRPEANRRQWVKRAVKQHQHDLRRLYWRCRMFDPPEANKRSGRSHERFPAKQSKTAIDDYGKKFTRSIR